MNDFKFTKAIMNNEQAKTNSKFTKMTELDRIERIHDNMNSMFNTNKEDKPDIVVEQKNTDIFKSRIDAINNIKKD